MTLSVSRRFTRGRSMVLALRGQLDYAGAPDLRAVISVAADGGPRPPRIVLDLSGVTSIDHVGVGTLVVANRICQQVGIDLAISSPSPLIRQLLGLAAHGSRQRHEPEPPVAVAPGGPPAGGRRDREWIDARARAG